MAHELPRQLSALVPYGRAAIVVLSCELQKGVGTTETQLMGLGKSALGLPLSAHLADSTIDRLTYITKPAAHDVEKSDAAYTAGTLDFLRSRWDERDLTFLVDPASDNAECWDISDLNEPARRITNQEMAADLGEAWVEEWVIDDLDKPAIQIIRQ